MDMSQGDLALKINLSRTSVVNIEQGRQHPSLYLLWQISEALKVSIFDLIPVNHANTSASELLSQTSKNILQIIDRSAVSESSLEKLKNLTQKIIAPDHE
ncbi:hypothetical protein GCM10027275_49830 [Rhabdobacter roseus]